MQHRFPQQTMLLGMALVIGVNSVQWYGCGGW
jgi:hypothetical protein